MSIFGNIMSAIFGKSAAASPAPGAPASGAPAPGPATSSAPASGAPAAGAPARTGAQPAAPAAPSTTASAPARAAISEVDVGAIMDKLAKQSKEKLDWRKSIVDLMKLLDLDSSLKARKELAQELHYSGDMNDSAKMNVWLHKQVMVKLAENGGKVPEDLKS